MLPLELWLAFGERPLRVETVAIAQEQSGQDCGSAFAVPLGIEAGRLSLHQLELALGLDGERFIRKLATRPASGGWSKSVRPILVLGGTSEHAAVARGCARPHCQCWEL
jgi:hypothetical protein